MSWLALVVLSTLGGLAIYFVVGGYYHFKYYVRRANDAASWKCQPKRWPRPGHQREAIGKSTLNLSIAGLVTGSLIYAVQNGHVEMPVYTAVAERGWLYTLLTTGLLFLLLDGIAYYVHRGFHWRPLFRAFHRHHHRYIATTPFVVVAMHPVEFLALQLATFVPLFIIPFHVVSVAAVFVYVFVFNIIDHSGVRLTSAIPWQGPSSYHDDHHVDFHCNFGQRLHGTLRRVDRRYGKDVFGGKGAPAQAQTEERAEYVRY